MDKILLFVECWKYLVLLFILPLDSDKQFLTVLTVRLSVLKYHFLLLWCCVGVHLVQDFSFISLMSCHFTSYNSCQHRYNYYRFSFFKQLFCRLVAISLHYFYMAAFSWLYVEVLHIYRLLTEKQTINYGSMKFYYLLGYGEFEMLRCIFLKIEMLVSEREKVFTYMLEWPCVQ